MQMQLTTGESGSPAIHGASGNRQLGTRGLWIVAALGLVIAAAAVVRIAPHYEYYPIPGVYRAYSVYDIKHILNTGHEIRPNEEAHVTSYSSGVYLGTQDVLRHKLEAAVILFLGLDETDLEGYYRFGLWQPLFIFPLMMLAVYQALARANRQRTTLGSSLLLLAFALLGSFQMLSVSYHGESNTATGWAFTLGALWALIQMPSAPVLGRALFFLFSFVVILLYHTSAVVLGCVLFVLLITSMGTRHVTDAAHSRTTILTVLIGIVAYFTYVSVSFLSLFAATLVSIPSLLEYVARGQSAPPRDFALRDLLSTNTDPTFVVPLVVSAAAVATPYAIALGAGLFAARWRASAAHRRVIWPWLLGIVPFALALFAWSGFSGVMWKVGEFGSLFAIIAAASLLAVPLSRITRTAVSVAMIAAIPLAVYLYVSYESHGASYLSWHEQAAGEWLSAQAQSDEVVFTDLRLAAPLIVDGHMAVVGINDYEAPVLVRDWLTAVYYGEDGSDGLRAMREVPVPPDTDLRYAMFSDRSTQDLPGIKGFDYTFRAAPENFTDKYLTTDGMQLIYDQGGVRIFQIGSP